MGSSNNTSTQTSGPNNKVLNDTLTKVAGGIKDYYQPGGSAYVAPGSVTTGGWQASLGAAGNPAFASGVNGAIGSYSNRAAGNELGVNDPGYAALREKIASDTLTGINKSFNNSGMFGSFSNQKSAAEGLAGALAGLDYKQYGDSLNRQTEAATLLPQLFAAGQLPASIQQSVGASMDADKAAQQNGKLNYLRDLTGLIGGAAGASGTSTTTSTPTAPLWQTLLGLGLQAL